MKGDYASEYVGTFPPPDKMLYDLAREYHERCEAYDRTVHWPNGSRWDLAGDCARKRSH